MLDHDEFIPEQLRAAVFTPRLQQLQVAHVAGRLLQLEEFTGDPMILPIPADAPPEIPRIVLVDSTRTTQLQVAVSRSDLFLNRQPDVPLEIGDFFGAHASRILEALLNALNVRPGRLAAIGTFSRKCGDPAGELASHFCKQEWVSEGGALAELGTFELHAHRRFELIEGLLVNSWVRCKSGLVSEAGMSSPAVVVERDVNTLPEEASSRQFDPDELKGFMKQAGSSLSDEIPKFFRGAP